MDDWAINESATEDLDRKRDTLIRIVFQKDPDQMDDDEYARRWNELLWASKNGFLSFQLKD